MNELINRTGIATSPVQTEEMVVLGDEVPQQEIENDNFEDYVQLKRVSCREAGLIGSVPQGLTAAIDGRQEILIDKLGERLAFERSGVRLYDALLLKCEESQLDLPLTELRKIRDDEQAHFWLLKETLLQLGADPTAETPCADVAALASVGLVQALNDPRITVIQALNTILSAELTDNAGWDLLVRLSENAGLSDSMIASFKDAQSVEERHVHIIQDLLYSLLLDDELIDSVDGHH